jgi:4-amino-4-deoxy-L-arabinose transferase-like glycosyltransferase
MGPEAPPISAPPPGGQSIPQRAAGRPVPALLVILLPGAVLRLFPIWFGLPYLRARPDEETAIAHALAILGGDLNPHFFHWPSVTFYTFAALYAAASGVLRALSLDPALTAVDHVLIARGFVALAGTLTIAVLFGLARRVAGEMTGLLAAAFLAVAILHVRDSHFAMTDVLMTLLVTASLALLLRGLDTEMSAPGQPGAIRWFAAAGLVGGLAASTKYNAAAIVAAMGAAQLLCLLESMKNVRRWRAWAPSIAFLTAFAVGFIAGTPYALLDFRTFAADLRYDFAHLSTGHTGNFGRGWFYHLKRSLPYGVGVSIFIAAMAGIVPFVKHYPRYAAVIGTFSAVFFAAIGSGYTVFFRYILPLVPIVCLLAAVAVRHGGPWLASRTGLSNRAALALLTVLVGGPALVYSAWLDVLLARTDTRVLAGRWLAPRLKAAESLHEAGGPYVGLDLADVRFHSWGFNAAASSFGDPEGRTPDWLVLQQSPLWTYASAPLELRQLAAEKYSLVRTFRATTGRARSAVYDLEDAFFMPVSGFRTVERPGPTILIYRRRDAPPVAEE